MKILKFLGWFISSITYGLSIVWLLFSIFAMVGISIHEMLARLEFAEPINPQVLLWTSLALLFVFILSSLGLAHQRLHDRKRYYLNAPPPSKKK